MKKEMATIKPSEHLELIIHRIDRMLKELVPVADVRGIYEQRILDELDRLMYYLRERGE